MNQSMLFTPDHDEVRRSLQKFIASEINPHVDEWEKADIFPAHELFKKLGNLGFLGLNKPEAFGGQGLDYSYALMIVARQGISAATPNRSSPASAQASIISALVTCAGP